MKNKLTNLNDHLFMQLERLGEEGLKGDMLKEEIDRSKAMSAIAKDIVSNGRLVFDVQKTVWDRTVDRKEIPSMLTGKGGD